MLIAYDILPLNIRDKFPLEKANIKPKVRQSKLSVAVIGIRDVISTLNLFPVKKLFCKFDISGDTKEAIITNPHPVIGGSSNFFEILALELDVPLDI